MFGIFCGLTAAMLNSVGYLFSANCLKHCKTPVIMLVFAQIWMLILSVPFLLFLFPEQGIPEKTIFFTNLIGWTIVFFVGQGCFFAALKYFEASRFSSLLGLKIIVLTVIYMFVQRAVPGILHWIAVFMAAAAAVMINWSSGGKSSLISRGWGFVFATLVCYSLADITETNLVNCFVRSGLSTLRSAFIATAVLYTTLGIVSLPGLFWVKFDKKVFLLSMPYSLFWLLSQAALMMCFALVQPVFGNVILASRGIFSVILGALLAWMGIRGIDAKIPRKQWIRRGFAAILMVLAIAIYSFAVNR